MERFSTGIDKLDQKLSGGYPGEKVILITGVAGSGKTIFGIHFLHRSCLEGKKCMMIATEETPEDILYQASLLGHDLRPYYESGQLLIERDLPADVEFGIEGSLRQRPAPGGEGLSFHLSQRLGQPAVAP